MEFIPLQVEGGEAPIRSFNIMPTKEQYIEFQKVCFQCACCKFVTRPHKDVLSGYLEMISFMGKSFVACSMCAGALNIGRKVSGDYSYGKIIYAPELSQKNVNDLVRINSAVIFNTSLDKEYRNRSQSILSELNSERYFVDGDVHSCFEGTRGNIKALADIYTESNAELKSYYPTLFKDLRFLPNHYGPYKEVIEYWIKSTPHYFHQIDQLKSMP